MEKYYKSWDDMKNMKEKEPDNYWTVSGTLENLSVESLTHMTCKLDCKKSHLHAWDAKRKIMQIKEKINGFRSHK